MKKKLILLLISAAVLLAFTGCKSLFTEEGSLFRHAKTFVRQDRYAEAVDNLSRAVSIDPEYKKAILYLEEIYPEGLIFYRAELERSAGLSDLASLDYRVSLYRGLTGMVRSVGLLPTVVHPETGAALRFETPDYEPELERAVEGAAEGWYLEGKRLAALDERESYKASSKAFLKCLEYIPGYKDAVSLERRVRDRAIQALVFLPFRGDNYRFFTLDANEMLQNLILADISSDQATQEYTRIVDQSVLDQILTSHKLGASGLFDESSSVEIGKLVNANMIFSGTTNQISLQPPEVSIVTKTREEEVDATAADLEGREPLEGEMVTVEAELSFYTKEAKARVIVSYNLIDIETGTVILSDTLRSDVEDSISWLEYEGDDRVLTDNEEDMLAVINRNIKDTDELLVECLEELSEVISGDLKSYLR